MGCYPISGVQRLGDAAGQLFDSSIEPIIEKCEKGRHLKYVKIDKIFFYIN